MKVWFLEGLYGPRNNLQRIRVSTFPFDVGRGRGVPLRLESPGISRVHARLETDDEDRLFVDDLGSTNGTFVNRERIDGRIEIKSGDIIHFASEEFRAVAEDRADFSGTRQTVEGIHGLPENLPGGAAQLQQLLLDSRVTSAFQPIVSRDGKTLHAYEMLARGTHPGLPEAPKELFRIAESLGLEVQLSELMRRISVDLANASNPHGRFFANIHPSEMLAPQRLMACMHDIRRRYPELRLVVEIHESAVADRELLEHFNATMRAADIGIAYDDFGVGQSRMMELADVPPDYVKLDGTLIRDPHRASEARRQMVAMIVEFARENGIHTIAEGVSGGREARYCDELGLDYMQGYHFGYPDVLERKS